MRSQTINFNLLKIMLIAGVTSAVIMSFIVAADIRGRTIEGLIGESKDISNSAPGQARQLASNLLVPEEHAAVDLFLNEIKKIEGLEVASLTECQAQS